MLEHRYTSTSTKLLQHPDRFMEWKQGILRPIALQLGPTDSCNLNCSFCSGKNRVGDELDYGCITKALIDLQDLGLEAVEITGGGEPSLYPHFNDLIDCMHSMGLTLGMVSNGVGLARRIKPESADKLQWLRISLNAFDLVNRIDIPPVKGTLGYSYVVHDGTSKDAVVKIRAQIQSRPPAYFRILNNCLTTETMEQGRKIAAELGLILFDNSFFQTKIYDVPHHCQIGYLKPFLAPDGFFYHCSAHALIARRFDNHWRMGRWDEVAQIWGGKAKPFDTSLCQTGKCFFKDHNDLIDLIQMDIQHSSFL